MANEEIDYTTYKDKAPTDLQRRFPEWLKDKVGVNPSEFRTKDEAFAAGVRLAVALRIPFQASPENKAATAAARSERAAAAPAPRVKAAPASVEEPTEAPKPRRGRKAAAPVAEAPAPAAAPAATTGRRRRATTATAAAF